MCMAGAQGEVVAVLAPRKSLRERLGAILNLDLDLNSYVRNDRTDNRKNSASQRGVMQHGAQ